MVIDAKLPPEDSPPLSVPPPAYAPSSESSPDPSRNAPHVYQQYPPPSTQPPSGSPPSLPQWHGPAQGTQSMSADEWAGHQYRNQRESVRGCSPLLSHRLFTVYARCARGNHDVATSFGLCGIICAILLFPIGLIFLWYAII
jgi:hypothetical protein